MRDVGGTIGPFEIRGQLGRGAMAWVWRAWDPSLDRVVAIKEPIIGAETPPEAQERFIERFLREGKAAAALNHPGIVTVYSAAVYDGRPVIVMELINGPTLRTVFRHGGLTVRQTYALMDQLLASVGYAHEHRVVHRDLKPDNVFVTPEGRVKLADFGVAQIDSSSMLTQVGTVIGTPAYMSPEQIRGLKTDSRSDVFSLGVIAYEALAGRNPFGSDTDTQMVTVMHRIVNEPVPALHVGDAPMTGPMAAVVFKALEKDPADRFENALEMRNAWIAAYPERLDTITALAGIRTSRVDSVPVAASPGAAATVLEELAPVESALAIEIADEPDSQLDVATIEPAAVETPEDSALSAVPIAAPLAPEAIESEPVTDVATATVPAGFTASVPGKRPRRWIPIAAVLIVAAAVIVPVVAGSFRPRSAAKPIAATRPTKPSAPVEATSTPEPTQAPTPVSVALSMKASDTSIKKGKSVRLSVSAREATGSAATAKVAIQRRTKSGWTTVKTVVLAGGKASVKLSPSKTTSYRAWISMTAELKDSHSKTVKIRVTVPPPPPQAIIVL